MDFPVSFKLPLEIVKEADKCQKDHACLNDRHYTLCEVDFQREKAHFGILVCGYETDCPYSSQIGSQRVCTCPVRQELFKKYQI